MFKYICEECGYLYDETKEITSWQNLMADWHCPKCQASKTHFKMFGVGDEMSLDDVLAEFD